MLTHSVRISRMVLESIGLGNFSISVMEKEKRKDPVLSRREIFTSITHTVKNKAESFVYHRQKAIGEKLIGKSESKEGIRPSPRREFLRKLLKEKGGKNDTLITYQQELPWGTIRIDEKNCCGCGT
ncbi:MAG: hypothetical protein JRJ60_09715, partial [Deltaproteobacteria bacterium]|nr:hypothetical protein [Deltaproteobacteria bacterium]